MMNVHVADKYCPNCFHRVFTILLAAVDNGSNLARAWWAVPNATKDVTNVGLDAVP